jgi:hypothetical protein
MKDFLLRFFLFCDSTAECLSDSSASTKTFHENLCGMRIENVFNEEICWTEQKKILNKNFVCADF